METLSLWWYNCWSSTLFQFVFAAVLSWLLLFDGATTLRKAAAGAAAARTTMRRAVVVKSTSTKQQGDTLFRKKRYKEALEKYQQCLCQTDENDDDDDDDTDTASRQARAEAYHCLAKTYQKLHMLTEAIEAAQSGLDTIGCGGGGGCVGTAELEMLIMQLTEARKNKTCRHCGKTPALEICGRCKRSAYCSAECQAAHWLHHKEHECFNDANDDTAKTTAHCQNCFQLLNKAGKQLMCSRCGRSPYCSRSCQRQHFPLHKLICKDSAMSDQEIDQLGIPALTAWRRLFDTWKEKSPEYLCYLATFAMSKRDFVQQPPAFVIVVKVAFNYNYGTFLPIGNPQKVAVVAMMGGNRDLPERHLQQEIENVCRYKAMTGRTDVVGHVVLVETETPLRTASTIPIIVPASAFQSEPHVVSGMKDFCLFPQQQYLSRWRPLTLHNLSYQISVLRQCKELVFAKFVSGALRLHSRKPRDRTHVLFVYFEPGLGIGEIQKLTEFEVEAVEKAQESLSGVFATRAELQSVLQKYFRPRTSGSSKQDKRIIPIFFSSDAGTTISEVSINVAAGQGTQTNQSSNEDAREAFAALQSAPLPPVESPGFDEI